MTKRDSSFDDWFSNLQLLVLDHVAADFRDAGSVRHDYEAGRNVFDVADEIAAEYQD